MQKNYDDFFKEKINEIELALTGQDIDMFDLIGSIRDRFSSPYISSPIASLDVINDLWAVLLKVFFISDKYDNRFDAIMTMSCIFLYAKRIGIHLNVCELSAWREKHSGDDSTEEVLECVDDILLI